MQEPPIPYRCPFRDVMADAGTLHLMAKRLLADPPDDRLRDGRCARDNAQERKPAAREVQTTDDCEPTPLRMSALLTIARVQ
jgi:hypothetical protein